MSTLRFLNNKARTHHIAMAVDKDLVQLFSEHHDGTLMTLEAYETLKSKMGHEDLQTHQVLFWEPSVAAQHFSNVLTAEDLGLSPF